MENKREKFTRLAENRTNNIIKTLNLLSNLSNRKNYEFNEEHIKKVFRAIDKELKLCKNKFTDSKSYKKFKL